MTRLPSQWSYMCEYAIEHNEMADYMLGNGKYYWSGDKNRPGPVYPPSILKAIYTLYETDKESNVLEIFKAALLKLCKGTPYELMYGVIYFETHCRNEKAENSPFCFDSDFIESFLKTVGDRCENEEAELRGAKGNIWRSLVVFNNALIVKTNIKKGFLRSYSVWQAWAEQSIDISQIKDMLKGIDDYKIFGEPVDVKKVLRAYYDLDRQNPFGDTDSGDVLERKFFELLSGNNDDIYLSARYFVYQLIEEKNGNSSFKMDEEFKQKYIGKLTEICKTKWQEFKTETTIYGDNKWEALKKLNDILPDDLGFGKGFLKL